MVSQHKLDQLPDVLSVDDVAKFLRIGRSSVYEAIRRRQIKSMRIGRRILVPKAVLDDLLDVSESEEEARERLDRETR